MASPRCKFALVAVGPARRPADSRAGVPSCRSNKAHMNRRRTVGALLALAVAARSVAAGAQQPTRIWRIGYLGPPVETAPHLLKAFRDGLRDFGYVEGRNVTVEYRWTTDRGALLDEAALRARASELVAEKPDVLAASIDLAVIAAKKVAGNLPIVMMNVSDPVELGFVASLAHPGGNMTGLTRLSPELVGKNLQLLVEVVPGLTRVAMLTSLSNGISATIIRNARQAAESHGVALQVVEARTAAEIDAAFATFKRADAQGVLVPGDGIFFAQRVQIAGLAVAQRLPAISSYTESVEAGALLAYSPSSTANYRRVGGFIDKILRGTPPGDIPIEQPTSFELALNAKTAKAIGIVLPQTLLLRADRVIE